MSHTVHASPTVFSRPLRPALLAILLGALGTAQAAPAKDDLTAIRAQLAQMQASYEARIAALEQRLASAEKQQQAQEHATAVAVADARNAQATADAASQARQASSAAPANAFNPEMSLILSGNATRLSQDPGRRRIQGFIPAGGEALPTARSFHLGESELAISANIDPYLRGNFRLSLAPDNTVGVEEASIQTLGLGNGFTGKAGRFLSGIGYLNEQHPHEWDFSDAPLAYQAFFGGNLGVDGVQAKWLAPTETFLEFGAETARARSFPATDEGRNKNGLMSASLFAHAGGDVGDSHSWRAGASLFAAKPRERGWQDQDSGGGATTNTFSGNSRTLILDGVWKWAPDGDASQTYVKLQGEYFRRHENGTLNVDDSAGSNRIGSVSDGFRSTQSGWYAQAVYQFLPRWRTGLRFDRLDSGSFRSGLIDRGTLSTADLNLLQAFKPRRETVMVDYNPSEFSRFRLQLARDRSQPESTDNQVWLQYIVSLGAHGAHKF
jgi:hypothetical protein